MYTLSLSNGGLKLHGVRRLAEIRVLTKARTVWRAPRACVVLVGPSGESRLTEICCYRDVDGRCGELDQDLWGSGYPLGADGLRLRDCTEQDHDA